MKKYTRIISVLLVIMSIINMLAFSSLFTSATETNDTQTPETQITMPRVYVTTEDKYGTGLLKKHDYVKAYISIVDTDGTTIEDDVQIKVRGNSTALDKITKKAYTFKFDSKTDVFGMGKAKKWALLANAFDPTQMRNYLAFDFAQTMGLEFTSEQRYVELWLDNVYRGCYILTEPVEEGATRVNIDIDSNNGMKDFLIEKEHTRFESDVTYFTTDDIRFAVKEPEEPNNEQLDYIKATMDDITETIKSGDKEAIASKIDIESFAKYYLLNEIFKPLDFDFSSVFFYYKDGKLYCGPAWDYDLSSGNITSIASDVANSASKPDGLFASNAHFFKYLCTYDWFNNEISLTYTQYYDYIENIAADNGLIDTLLNDYSDIFEKNFTDTEFNITDWWVLEQAKPQTTFKGNVDFLKTWLNSCHSYLSTYYDIPFFIGDVNNDKDISVLDATFIQRHVAQISSLADIFIKADFNQDNEITIMDATAIQRYIARL